MKRTLIVTIAIVLIFCFAVIASADVFRGQQFDEEKKPDIAIDGIPEGISNVTKERGTVEYKTVDIETGWLTGEYKQTDIAVYTPYGYSDDLKYNVIIIPCTNISLQDYMDGTYEVDSVEYSAAYMFDYISYQQVCDPFIVVAVHADYKTNETSIRYLAYLLRNCYLPYIVSNYSTYAESGFIGDLIENRNHFAMLGIKGGADYVYTSGIVWNIDIFSSFGFVSRSGRSDDIKDVIDVSQQYPINEIVCVTDKSSSLNNDMKYFYNSLLPYFQEDDASEETVSRLDLIETNCSGQSNVVELIGLYDAALNLFKDGFKSRVPETHAHMYRDNHCIICGKEPVYFDKNLPKRFYTECPQQGEVVEFAYTTRDYFKEGSEPYGKHGLIYLPYGYDEEKQYDVMIILHGHTLNRHAWMDQVLFFDWGCYSTYRNDYDWIFYDNITNPKLIVTLDTPAEPEYNFEDMKYELRCDVLPYLAEHFATYAKSGEEEDLIAARDHFGLGGSSNGGGFTHGSGLKGNIDVFGSFMLQSGGMNAVGHAKCMNEVKDQYKVNCFVRCSGKLDKLRDDIFSGYQHVGINVDYLEKNKNLYYFELSNVAHNMRVGYVMFVDALQVLFPKTEPDNIIDKTLSVVYQILDSINSTY